METSEKENQRSEKFRRIRRMMLTRVLTAPFLIVMLVFGVLVYYFADNLKQKAGDELSLVADGHRALINQFLSDQASILDLTASTHSFVDMKKPAYLKSVFLLLQRHSATFVDLGVFDETGRHVAYVGPYDLEGRDYSEEEWFKTVREQGIYISDVFLGYRQEPHFIVAVQKAQDGRRWFLRATIDTVYFSELVKGIKVGRTGEAYLVNGAGVFQTERRSGGGLQESDPDIGLYRSAGRKIDSFVAIAADGKRYLYATGRLEETGWIMVVRQDLKEAYAPLTRAIAMAVIVIALGGGIVVLTAYLLSSALAGQLALADAEKREMGTKLLIAGKLAEVGEMSAGMAHEINNPLQVMVSECTMLQDILSEVDPPEKPLGADDLIQVRDCINQLGLQIDRCRAITQGLLKFARKTDTTLSKIDMGELVGEVVAMVEHRALIDGIDIRVDPGIAIPPVMSDSSQLQQVFLNLINNAVFAVRERENPEVRIAVVREEDEVAISVADNGCGIEAENLKKIFLPFYTTKPVGEGTGLGLSTCYGIVERLGGRISVESELNTGTVFTVRLPLVEAAADAGA